MRLLAVDAAGEALTAALLCGGRLFSARRAGRTPSDELILPLVESLLRRAGTRWDELDAVAAASGPGRFTGIRVGMAFAAAAGFRLRAPALAISRLEARALAGAPGARVLAALPGWKGEIYHQRFRRAGSALRPDGAAAWAAPADWPRLRAAAESEGLAVSEGEIGAAELLAAARARLESGTLPPFEPFYLKPAGYEKPRR